MLMSRRLIFSSLLAGLLFTITTMGVASALTGGKYLPEAKVPLAQARRLALKTYQGKIMSEELEKESGGSGLRYSFVIRRKNMKHEVGIDAKTGEVLENSIEGKHPD
jgi:uncharacterized membrane protein YkoI